MNINLKFLLGGMTACLIPQYTAAQCVVTDCLQLGYTSLQKCDNGLKCPFGEYWACPKTEEKAVLGQCTGYAKNCKIGDILNSDGTCTAGKNDEKKPIGIVVYINPEGCGQVLSAQSVEAGGYRQGTSWRPGNLWYSNEMPVGYKSDSSTAKADFDSCGNTRKIIEADNSLTYPATWRAYLYAPQTAPETRGKWCLPAAGILQQIKDNNEKINEVLSLIGGENLNYLWSSTQKDTFEVWIYPNSSSFTGITAAGTDGSWISSHQGDRTGSIFVRPVIEF